MNVTVTGTTVDGPYVRLARALKALGPTAVKGATNPHFRSGYVKLPDLLEFVRPELEKEDLILTQPLQDLGRPDVIGVCTLIIDAITGDELLESCLPIPTRCEKTDKQGNMVICIDPQKATSAVTYARRTGITSLLGIGEKDDDGNAASINEGMGKGKAATSDIFDV